MSDSLPFAESSAFTFNAYTFVTDTDQDGMPDAWETANGLNRLLNDASANPDGDAFTNIQGYNAGTDPQVADNADEAFSRSPKFTYDGVDSAQDSNSNGLPDLWEEKYGLLATVNDSSGNPDDDSFSNLSEYRKGLHPPNPISSSSSTATEIFSSLIPAANGWTPISEHR